MKHRQYNENHVGSRVRYLDSKLVNGEPQYFWAPGVIRRVGPRLHIEPGPKKPLVSVAPADCVLL